MTACIVGWAHTPFGKLSGETVESLIVRVANEALADASIAASDVDVHPWGNFVTFSDPDGNTWSLQELPAWRSD